jgi:uncharacterized Zn-finger protein
MTTIRCPICDTAIAGQGEMALSSELRDHLVDRHGFRDLCETSSFAASRGPEFMEMPRGYDEPAAVEMGQGVSVLCPFCGFRLLGRDGEALSYGLHHHVEDVHGLRSTRLLHWLKY